MGIVERLSTACGWESFYGTKYMFKLGIVKRLRWACAASVSNSQMSDDDVLQRYKALFSSQTKTEPKFVAAKTAAVATTTDVKDEYFITYLA
jgi:hypothetical protein